MAEKDESRPEPVIDHGSINGDTVDKTAIGSVTEVQGNTHYHETVTSAPMDPWSRTSIQLYFILLVAALNATSSGFDGVSEEEEAENQKYRGIMAYPLAVDLQLHQCHGSVQGILPPYRAWFCHRNVSVTPSARRLSESYYMKRCLTRALFVASS